MDPRHHILLVEDDERLARLVREYLEGQGFEVSVEGRGDTAPERIRSLAPDLVVLDLMLPGRDGLDVCREVRPNYDGPILILTAREDDMDQVAGLEIGADDYVKKPVEPRVLLARVRALLRRAGSGREAGVGDLRFGVLRIDDRSRRVHLDGEEIDLTTTEYDLLVLLATHAGSVLSRDDLFRRLRGIEYDGIDRSVDIAISRLRRKLEADPADPQRIRTVWRRGYLFAPDAW